MKASLILASLLFVAALCAEANQTPIAVTGFNQDVIVDAATPVTSVGFQSSLTATMDGGTAKTGNTWYQLGENTSAPTTGLPTGTTFVSASDPSTSFALQSATGNNAIMLDSSNAGGSFTLTTPAVFSSLSLLGASAVGSTTLGVTLQFSDLTTLSLDNLVVQDWFNGAPVVYSANGRISATGFNSVSSGNPRLYQYDLALPSAALIKPILDITFTDVSGGQSRAAIFGLSGSALVAVPESASTIGFLVIGLAGLIGLHLRRRVTCRKASA